MATTTWRSSLANIEGKLRRGLGLTGPVDLELAPKELTPVILVQDLTRAGNASQLRGRRWQLTLELNSIGLGNNGSCVILADSPYISTGTSGRPNTFEGGIQVDLLEVDVYTTAASQQLGVAAWFLSEDVVRAGLPYAVTSKLAPYVDPMRSQGEVAPVFSGTSLTVAGNAAGGFKFWQRRFNAAEQHFTIPVDWFINWNAAVAIGTSQVTSNSTIMNVSVHGHIF